MISSDRPIEPIGWQPGLDWEIRRTERGFQGDLFERATLLRTVEARTRLTLGLRMWWAQRRAKQ